MYTNPNTEYMSDQLWLSDVTPKHAVLCKRTALLMLGLITGNVFENRISIYKDEDVHNGDRRVQKIHGVICTTPEQTITDMLNDNEMYDAELAEGMANYYYLNHESFDALPLSAKAAPLFGYYSEWAKDYYNEG